MVRENEGGMVVATLAKALQHVSESQSTSTKREASREMNTIIKEISLKLDTAVLNMEKADENNDAEERDEEQINVRSLFL